MGGSRLRSLTVFLVVMSLVCLTPWIGAEAGQGDNAKQAYAILLSIANNLTSAPGGGGQPEGATQARQDVEWLAGSLTGQAPGPPTPVGSVNQQMIRGLRADDEALIAARGSDGPRRKALLESVYEDLRLKTSYCKASPDRMNAVVDISVQTWDADKEAKSWQVAYLNAPLAILHPDLFQSFPKFSSPTRTKLPPGRYIIWAQDPKSPARRGPAKEVSLGSGGTRSLDADLMIPRP